VEQRTPRSHGGAPSRRTLTVSHRVRTNLLKPDLQRRPFPSGRGGVDMSLPGLLSSFPNSRLSAYLCLGGALLLGLFAGYTPVGLFASMILLIGSVISGVRSIRSARPSRLGPHGRL
jgi:hypothetical protein